MPDLKIIFGSKFAIKTHPCYHYKYRHWKFKVSPCTNFLSKNDSLKPFFDKPLMLFCTNHGRPNQYKTLSNLKCCIYYIIQTNKFVYIIYEFASKLHIYFLLWNLDKTKHMHFNFDACLMHSHSGLCT